MFHVIIEQMKFLNALNKINGVGAQKLRLLTGHFKEPEQIWYAHVRELEKSGIGASLAEKIAQERTRLNPTEEWEKLEKESIRLVTWEDDNYPELLREIPNPPYLLYIRGNFNPNLQPMLAMVGSRKYTRYGSQAAYGFAQELARCSLTVVSGLALGIDAIAHRGALDAHGRTVAVLGGSLDDKNIGPHSNFNLAREIVETGCLISEYPVETAPNPNLFPARNRLMAGMTLGTLVIEAAENSGSLITAGLALDFNREVFAVPGSVFSPASAGANRLIKNGAKMAVGAQDILEELRLERRQTAAEIKRTVPVTPAEESILTVLSHEPLQVDRIIKLTKLDASVANSILTVLEIKNLVKNIGGQNFIRL